MNTQTSKPVGASVATNEFLGNVDSSGRSDVPHLHFEVHDAQGNILDPYRGSCNAATSLWTTQKPYNEPTINALLTHTAPPLFNNCPQLASPSTSSLQAGASLTSPPTAYPRPAARPDGNLHHLPP